MRADQMVDEYLRVLRDLVVKYDYEVKIIRTKPKRSVRVEIGRPGEEYSWGAGSTIAVAAKNALSALLEDLEEDFYFAEVAPERFDELTHLIAGVV